MIAALVLFPVPSGTTLDQMREAYELSAPRFRDVSELLSKYYLFDGDTQGGAFYLWSTRATAESFFDATWREALTERYGAPPKLSMFEVPVAIDNVAAAR